jgi:glycosyltransferase involved in cell wall biosynthesis
MPEPVGGTPLRVRFSPDIFRVQRFGGVSRYIIELHRGLLAHGVDSGIVAGLHRSALLHDVPNVRGLGVDGLRPERARQALTRAADVGVAWWATSTKPTSTIWHASYFPRVLPSRGPLAVTVYDMIHERYSDEFAPRDLTFRYKRPACERADVVFAISRATADDLCERFAIDADRVVVTHLGVSPVQPMGTPRPFDGQPFLLYVGERRSHHKNWDALLAAIARLGPQARLVCFGADAGAWDHDQLVRHGVSDRVVFAGGDDAVLAGWYRSAAALVYPSLYEGFGLPPLEAMAHGCAVVATPVGGVPEVVGDVALLVRPDVEGLSEGIDAVLADGPDVARMRSDGPTRAACFTWEAMVDETLAGYRRCVD